MVHQSHKIGYVWKPGFLKSGHIAIYPKIYNRTYTVILLGVVIITTPASPLPIELVATTENV